MAVIVPTKLGGYVPASMTSLRLMLLPVLAYGLIFCAMLWRLGRSIKQLKAAEDELPIEREIPRQAR